jgi:hypothetical protein
MLIGIDVLLIHAGGMLPSRGRSVLATERGLPHGNIQDVNTRGTGFASLPGTVFILRLNVLFFSRHVIKCRDRCSVFMLP